VTPVAGFDSFASDYEEALEMGLRLSGESSMYFAQGRVEALCAHLAHSAPATPVRAILDFGCGTGSTTPLLRELPGVERVIGVDVSERLLERARAAHGGPGVEFRRTDQLGDGEVDLAYCNGVFHHIPIADRPQALSAVRAALRPGGLFALCENNPWNPGTRMVMRAIPFDRDAIPISPSRARRMLNDHGFEVEATRFLFFFPRALSALRRVEPRLGRVPLGAQYMVLARRS
jgi:SAM-dependent methyltransferase